jgi:hypothetical protein
MDEFRLEMGRKVTAGGVDGRGFTLAKQHALFEIDATVAVVTFINTTVLVDCKVRIGSNSFGKKIALNRVAVDETECFPCTAKHSGPLNSKTITRYETLNGIGKSAAAVVGAVIDEVQVGLQRLGLHY